MVLVDTSVWVAVFRKRDPLDLEEFVALDDVVLCLPVIQEILQGIGDQSAYRLARQSLTAFPIVESPLSLEVFDTAIDLYRRAARRKGLTVRSSVDCLISACALRNDLIVLHRDRDYDALSKIAPLGVRHV